MWNLFVYQRNDGEKEKNLNRTDVTLANLSCNGMFCN